MYKILNDNLKRTSSIGSWESPDLIDYNYWDVRRVLPNLLADADKLLDYIVKNYADKVDLDKISQADKLSFYFFVRDELEQIAITEQSHLVNRYPKKSKYKPSPRAEDYPELLELNRLSQGCPIKALEIKKLPYSHVFETLLAMAVENEGSYTE